MRAGGDARAQRRQAARAAARSCRQWIAESRAEIDAARLLVLRTAWRIDHEGAAAARDDVSLIKFYTAAVLQRVLDRAIQIHGALGLTEATPLAFWWRHERGARIYDGADEVHKTAVARRILERHGMPRGERPTRRSDAARPVRPGEEIDAAALAAWLAVAPPRHRGPGRRRAVPRRPLEPHLPRSRLGDRELVLRRPPFGSQVKTAHDMGREFRVLSRLYAAYPPAPRALLHCDDPEVIGAPFYLMERVRGVILRQPVGARRDRPRPGADAGDQRGGGRRPRRPPRRRLPGGGARRPRAPGGLRRAAGRRVDGALADAPAPTTCRTSTAPPPGSPRTCRAERASPALIHNDYKYDNLVLDPADLDRIVAVLDWEMATVGDPLMDLGTSLGYWMDPDDVPELRLLPAGPTTLPGNLEPRRGRRALRGAERPGRLAASSSITSSGCSRSRSSRSRSTTATGRG